MPGIEQLGFSRHNTRELSTGDLDTHNQNTDELDEQIIDTEQMFPSRSVRDSKVESIIADKIKTGSIEATEEVKSSNFSSGTSGWRIKGNGDVEFNSGTFRGSLVAGEIHIPDKDSTANSAHIDSNGNTWWGATKSDFDSNKDNANAYILNDGSATFHNITADGGTIGGWTLGSSKLSANSITLDSANEKITVGSSTPNVVIDGSSTEIKSSNYVSGVGGAGFSITPNLIEVGNLKARGKLRTAVFQKDVISSVGGNINVQDSDVLASDMTSADSESLTIDGDTTFSVGDILRIKNDTDDEWFEVTDNSSAPTYSVTRDKAGSYAADSNPAWNEGATVVNYGQSGDGGLFLTASETNAPYLQIFDHSGDPWNTQNTRVRIGNLNGYLGFSSDKYGIGIGESGDSLTYTKQDGLQVEGQITAETGTIGGFTIGTSNLTATNLELKSGGTNVANINVGPSGNKAGLNAAGASDDIAIWAGDDHANRASAPFRVKANGEAIGEGVFNKFTSYLVASGSNNDFTVSGSDTITSYEKGLSIRMEANHTITGPATVNLNSLGKKDILKEDGEQLRGGDILDGEAVLLIYDGSDFRIINIQRENAVQYEAGEDLDSSDAVYVSDGNEKNNVETADPIQVQRGSVSFSNGGSTSKTVNLNTPVPKGESFALVTCKYGSGESFANAVFYAELKNLNADNEFTQIELKRGDTADDMSAQWQVVTHSDFTVQYINKTFTAGGSSSITESINTVNLSEAFLTYGHVTSNAVPDGWGQVYFSDNSTLTFERGDTAAKVDMHIQVVEWAGASVQSGQISGTSSQTINSVNLDNTFVLFNHYVTNPTTDDSGYILIRGYFPDSTTVNFSRSESTGTPNISYFVVEHSAIQVDNKTETMTSSGVNVSITDSPTGATFLPTPMYGNVEADFGNAAEQQNTTMYELKDRRTVGLSNANTYDDDVTAEIFAVSSREDRVAGKIYKATARETDTNFSQAEWKRWIGFNQFEVTRGKQALIETTGIDSGFSGLTLLSDYYLADKPYGTIQSSPGSETKQVGKAMDDTDLLIQH